MSNYKKISPNIQRLTIDNPETRDAKLEWVNVTNTSTKEIEFLRKQYKFDLAHLRASMAHTTSQRFILEKKPTYLFLIMHFPIFKGNKIVPAEIDFFIQSQSVITLHNGNLKPFMKFFNYCKKDSNSLLSYKFESASILLYEILNHLILYCYELIDQNSIAISNIEKSIFSRKGKKSTVTDILLLNANIINLRKIMQNHKNVFKKIVAIGSEHVPTEQLYAHYKTLIEHSKTFWEILDNQKEMVEALSRTNESLINFHISDIMKTLTIFSVIVFPLTLLAALFGMNVTGGMPFLESSNGFWIIMGLMLLGCFLMLWFFERKRWL